ncbi:MAG: putative sulfate exporter family transporter [Citromicrobium sp.]|nr:MAG: putative sulfate exporter family transporter [Citromicrobium sp.]
MHHPRRVFPGLVLCCAVTALAYVAQGVETALLGKAWVEALVLAIILGTAARSIWTPGSRWLPGIDFSAHLLLEIAVVLLGASVSAATILSIGPALLAAVVGAVALVIPASYFIGRLLGLPRRMAMLVACGNSICGNSAIAAVAPVIDADSDDVAAAIAFTAVLGVIVVLGLPLIGHLLGLSSIQYGAFSGLTVYAVPQVIAAAAPFGATAIKIGTIIKLVRVLMLGPICIVLSMIAPPFRDPEEIATSPTAALVRPKTLPLHRMVPWFIVGFTALATFRSIGLIPTQCLSLINEIATILTVTSMAALGLGVDIFAVLKAGGRVTLAVILSLFILGTMALMIVFILN